MLPLLRAAHLERLCTMACASQFQTASARLELTRWSTSNCLRRVAMVMAVSNPHVHARIIRPMDKYLGIKCYILSFPDGQQLGTVRENTMYGFFDLKVCKSTNDCSHGKEVEMDESFFGASKAGRFAGTPTCAGGECGIQPRGGLANGGIGPACLKVTPGMAFVSWQP